MQTPDLTVWNPTAVRWKWSAELVELRPLLGMRLDVPRHKLNANNSVHCLFSSAAQKTRITYWMQVMSSQTISSCRSQPRVATNAPFPFSQETQAPLWDIASSVCVTHVCTSSPPSADYTLGFSDVKSKMMQPAQSASVTNGKGSPDSMSE